MLLSYKVRLNKVCYNLRFSILISERKIISFRNYLLSHSLLIEMLLKFYKSILDVSTPTNNWWTDILILKAFVVFPGQLRPQLIQYTCLKQKSINSFCLTLISENGCLYCCNSCFCCRWLLLLLNTYSSTS
jgi:hypothetical protein